MDASEVIADAIGRIRDQVRTTAADLDPERLARRPSSGSNPIGWLLWHLTRVQDLHVAELLDAEQLYTAEGWAERLGLDPDADDSGFGHTDAQVAAIHVDDPGRLVAYHDAVAARSLALLDDLTDDDFDRIVDESWDPPVTAGVRWVSIVEDCMQHLGQAAYVRGLLGR